MGKQKRKRIDAESKISILQSHLMDKKPVSEVCEAHGIQPSLFYNWQRELFARGAAIFSTKPCLGCWRKAWVSACSSHYTQFVGTEICRAP